MNFTGRPHNIVFHSRRRWGECARRREGVARVSVRDIADRISSLVCDLQASRRARYSA